MTDPRRLPGRPLVRRDADGHERTSSSWESLTERLIREAQEAGAFDDLPGHGRPLELEDDGAAGDMAMANHLLRNAGAAPPWIEADKEVRRSLDAIEALVARAERSPAVARRRLERDLADLAAAHDAAVSRLEGLAPTSRQQRRRIDGVMLHDRLLEALPDSQRDS